MTVNLHIGTPSLLSDLIHEIGKSGILDKNKDIRIISKGEWKSHFRPSISMNKKKLSNFAAIPSQIKWINNVSCARNIAISQHTFLGKAADFFMPRYSLIDKINKIDLLLPQFREREVNIHVLIKDQYAYLKNLEQSDIETVLQGAAVNMPRWSDIVANIRRVAPRAKLIVWDCEDDSKIAFAFALWMLDFSDEKIMDEVYDFVCEYICKNLITNKKDNFFNFPKDIIDSLDLQYSIDCDLISNMRDIAFVRKDKVPSVFYVSCDSYK